jgi:hypothetical protein
LTIPECLSMCMSCSAEAERCCSSHSPALRPWIARSRKSSVVLRGGDLEPGALAASEIRRQKQRLIQQRIQPARSAEGPFSLRRGLESELWFLKLGITPFRSMGSGSKRRRRPAGSPSLSAGCGLGASARASERRLDRNRSGRGR